MGEEKMTVSGAWQWTLVAGRESPQRPEMTAGQLVTPIVMEAMITWQAGRGRSRGLYLAMVRLGTPVRGRSVTVIWNIWCSKVKASWFH